MAQIDACIYGRKIKRIFDSQLKEIRDRHDIKMVDVEILLFFYENKGKSASDVHRQLGLNKGQVSTGIDNLVKKGFLHGRVNPEDRRYLYYELNDSGVAVVKEIQEEICMIYKLITEGISKNQQNQFFKTGYEICNNIDKYYKD